MPPHSGEKRIAIVPGIHGKVTYDGKISEPDAEWIIVEWLKRHPEVENRPGRIRALSSRYTTSDGLRTAVVRITIAAGDDIADYDPEEDADFYRYWIAEDRYWESG